MPFKFTVLRSGSSGNATLVESTKTKILIDCGLEGADANIYAEWGIDIVELAGILITHVHSDHVDVNTTRIAEFADIPVYIHKRCLADLARVKTKNGRALRTALSALPTKLLKVFGDAPFKVGELRIVPFQLSHAWMPRYDYAMEEYFDETPCHCYGFRVEWKKGSRTYCLGYATDTGRIPEKAMKSLAGCNALVLESNHDQALVDASLRPVSVKKWIKGPTGHLANEDAAQALATLLESSDEEHWLRHVVLAHISKDCNERRLARQAVNAAINGMGKLKPALSLAHQHKEIEEIRVDQC